MLAFTAVFFRYGSFAFSFSLSLAIFGFRFQIGLTSDARFLMQLHKILISPHPKSSFAITAGEIFIPHHIGPPLLSLQFLARPQPRKSLARIFVLTDVQNVFFLEFYLFS